MVVNSLIARKEPTRIMRSRPIPAYNGPRNYVIRSLNRSLHPSPSIFPRVIYLMLCFFFHRMSNFQRTRSKVWWGDAPPNIGSPVAQPEWNQNNRRDEQEWEPQLPHWIANQPEQRNNSRDNLAQANNAQNQWPLRHGSPGSHKSQDSGFSDSDSSPPTSQYYSSPESSDKNKSSNSSDSNNNENITIKQAINFQNTSNSKDVVDNSKTSDNTNSSTPIPKPRLRSSSVIQTPYDLQKYCEIHQDEEHMELLKDKDDNKIESKYPASRNVNDNDQQITEKITKTVDTSFGSKSMRNVNTTSSKINSPNTTVDSIENTSNKSAIEGDTKDTSVKNLNMLSPSKKYPIKKFISNTDSSNTKSIKVAKVKDLESSKNKSNDSIEYIKLSHDNEIAVNNQPRVRTPITNVSYVPTERISATRPDYRRSMSNEENIPISTTPKFQRNRLNQSLNFEGQRLDQQILDIQDGYRSLGYIEEDELSASKPVYSKEQIHKPTKALLGKNIMDSLHLKPSKKVGPKAKHRSAAKGEKVKEPFKLFGAKKEKPGVVDSKAGGVLNGSRVPSLGLPRTCEQNSWVIVGYPENQEMLIPHYNERLVSSESDANLKEKDKISANDNFDKHGRLTPPPQFQDKQKIPYETDSKTDKDLTHDSKREKLKDDMNFMDVQLDLACTSTPKMLAPHEFMNGVKSSNKKNPRKVNLLENYNSG